MGEEEESRFLLSLLSMSLQKLLAVWNEEVDEEDWRAGLLMSAMVEAGSAEAGLASDGRGRTVPGRLGFSFKYEKAVG